METIIINNMERELLKINLLPTLNIYKSFIELLKLSMVSDLKEYNLQKIIELRDNILNAFNETEKGFNDLNEMWSEHYFVVGDKYEVEDLLFGLKQIIDALTKKGD